jgi:peptide/nickel transport system substrate-binding protein
MLTIALPQVAFPPIGRVTDESSVLTIRALFAEPLCEWENGAIRPAIFSAWAHDEAGLAWRFTIREGARFHDGVAVTAEHVLAAIEAVLGGVDSFGMPWSYARYLDGARYEALSRDVVGITTTAPLGDLPEILSEFHLIRADASGAPVIGTGRFRVVEHAPGRALLAAVDSTTQPSRVTLIAERDAEARHALLASGGADAALHMERMRAPLPPTPGIAWIRAVNTLSVMFYLDCGKGLFASPEARLAANLAVDRQRILDEALHGLGVLATTIVSPFHLGARKAALVPIPHDPERAKRLFAQAGATEPILLRTPTHMPERSPEITAMVAQDLERAGVPCRIETEHDRPEYARQIGRKRIADMAIFDSSPHSTYRVLSDKISSRVKGLWWQGHDDPELEPLIEQANRTLDDAARAAAYARCLRRLHENPPWLYLLHPVEAVGARDTLRGLSLDPRGILRIAT